MKEDQSSDEALTKTDLKKQNGQPSKLRKIIVLVIWYFGIVFIFMFLIHFIAEGFFSAEERNDPKFIAIFDVAKYVAQFGPLLPLIVLTGNGRLPGARVKSSA